MPNFETAGALISLDDAKHYVRRHLRIKETLQENVLSGLPPEPPAPIQIVEKYYGDNTNAFLFDVEKLIHLLTSRDTNDELPKYLMVLTGAKFEEGSEDENTPTIVLAGVNYDEKEERYYSMKLEKPALQQPPNLSKVVFPDIK